jgi:hypothetical protein
VLLSGKNVNKINETKLITNINLLCDGITCCIEYTKGSESYFDFKLMLQKDNKTVAMYMLETDENGNMVNWKRQIITSGIYSIPIPNTMRAIILELIPIGDLTNVGTLKVGVDKCECI